MVLAFLVILLFFLNTVFSLQAMFTTCTMPIINTWINYFLLCTVRMRAIKVHVV